MLNARINSKQKAKTLRKKKSRNRMLNIKASVLMAITKLSIATMTYFVRAPSKLVNL
jgi:hypothetical protein